MSLNRPVLRRYCDDLNMSPTGSSRRLPTNIRAVPLIAISLKRTTLNGSHQDTRYSKPCGGILYVRQLEYSPKGHAFIHYNMMLRHELVFIKHE